LEEELSADASADVGREAHAGRGAEDRPEVAEFSGDPCEELLKVVAGAEDAEVDQSRAESPVRELREHDGESGASVPGAHSEEGVGRQSILRWFAGRIRAGQ
jgi:hypothetical protein